MASLAEVRTVSCEIRARQTGTALASQRRKALVSSELRDRVRSSYIPSRLSSLGVTHLEVRAHLDPHHEEGRARVWVQLPAESQSGSHRQLRSGRGGRRLHLDSGTSSAIST